MAGNLPQDFTSALKAAGLANFFAGCTGPHQNEYLKWIGGAKKPETRQKRIARAMEMIGAKKSGEEARAKKPDNRKAHAWSNSKNL